MKKLGKELDFISFIKRDGSGTIDVGSVWVLHSGFPKFDDVSYMDNDEFEINVLSLSSGTFIATGFNTWVVKLKSKPLLDSMLNSGQLKSFADYAQKRMFEDGDKDLSEFVDDFLNTILSYNHASIRTIIIDLIQGSSAEEVFRVFCEVTNDDVLRHDIEEFKRLMKDDTVIKAVCPSCEDIRELDAQMTTWCRGCGKVFSFKVI